VWQQEDVLLRGGVEEVLQVVGCFGDGGGGGLAGWEGALLREEGTMAEGEGVG